MFLVNDPGTTLPFASLIVNVVGVPTVTGPSWLIDVVVADTSSDSVVLRIQPEVDRDAVGESFSRGLKRKFEEMIAMHEDPLLSDDAGAETPNMPLNVNQDGTTEQVDTVR